MQFTTILSVILVAVCAAVAQEVDHCVPKHPMKVYHGHCCKVPSLMPEVATESSFHKCKDKFGLPEHKPKKPPHASPPSEEDKKRFKDFLANITECLFKEAELLTEDNQLDKEKVKSKFISANESVNVVLIPAVDKCLASYADDIDQTLPRKSGADQFRNCVMREVFLNCPVDSWTDSEDCAELKQKTTDCPKFFVLLGHPSKHHHHHHHENQTTDEDNKST